jgi:hypothetical protein
MQNFATKPPNVIFVFHEEVRVDGVPIVFVLIRPENHALVDLFVVRTDRVEGFVRGETDG